MSEQHGIAKVSSEKFGWKEIQGDELTKRYQVPHDQQRSEHSDYRAFQQEEWSA